ncbi:MAG: hypothetical protein ABIJ56_19215 [Pseudomonadota bacterium]
MIATFLLVLLSSCSWFDGAPMTVQDARDGDVIADWAEDNITEDPGLPDVPDAAPDPDVIEDAGDVPVECYCDQDCDDTEPCNGMERCEAGQCEAGEPLEDGTPCVSPFGHDGECVDALCIPFGCGDGVLDDGEECDDGNGVSGDGCENNCTFSCHESADCDDENACTDDACSETTGGRMCTHEPVSGPCDDGLLCTLTDTCGDDGLCGGTGDPCDDGTACTVDTCREETDACDNAVSAGWCFIAGVCYMNGDDDPADACRRCASGESGTSWSLKDPGSPCSDEYACTSDACDEAGDCVSTPRDDRCGGDGALCRPACFPDEESGCGMPPDSMSLSCESPVDIRPWDERVTSDCDIRTGGYDGPPDCFACTGKLGVKVLASSGFEDGYDCDLDDWSPVSDEECCESMVACEPDGCDQECCYGDDYMCVVIDEEEAGLDYALGLLGEESMACWGYEELRIERSFDTSGMDNLSLCFDAAADDLYAIDAIMVFASDDEHGWTIVDCLDYRTALFDLYYLSPTCVELPDWAADNPDLEIKIALHSTSSGEGDGYLLIDNVSLRGWSSGCEPTIESVFTEDFTGCRTFYEGWHGWHIDEGSPGCTDEGGCSDTASAYGEDEYWGIERTVDTSSLDGNMELCFSYGQWDEGDDFEVSFNAGNGWHDVWYQEERLGDDGECNHVCVNLSDIDEDARRNDELEIYFWVDATLGVYLLDDIEVRGAVYCDAGDAIDIGEITKRSGEGHYRFTVTDVTKNQMSPEIHCTWGDPPDQVEDWDTIDFNL